MQVRWWGLVSSPSGWMIDEPPVAYPEWSVAVATPAEAVVIAERMILEDEVDALIVTQRVTAGVMKAVIDVAHAHQRRVMGQIWAVDGETAAKLGIDELHTSSRVYRSKLYPEERLLGYRSIAGRLALASRAWASLDWDLTLPIMEAMVRARCMLLRHAGHYPVPGWRWCRLSSKMTAILAHSSARVSGRFSETSLGVCREVGRPRT